MNRRHEARAILAFTLILALMPQSCESKRAYLSALVETFGNAMSQLATISGAGELADRIRNHTQTAVSIIRGWHPGDSAADAIRAINRVIDDINIFPNPERWKPLITLALGTAASIIEELSRATSPTADNANAAYSTGGPHTNVRIVHPPRNAKEFRVDWDSIRAGSTDLREAPVL